MAQGREGDGAVAPGRLPAVGAVVRAALPDHDVGLRSKIEDHDDDGLVIAAPVERPEVGPLPPGGELTLTWTTDAGLHRVRVRLVERLDDPPRWRVAVVTPVSREQRRDSYRVPVMGTIGIRLDGAWWTASLIDVSEGGVRCLLAGDTAITEGSLCEVTLDVVRPGLWLSGEVVRVREGVDATLDLGVRLTDVPASVGEELRRFVLAVQVARRHPE